MSEETPEASYDVVLVGSQFSNLVAAALLAKRGFRLLVLGQDELPPVYRPVADLELPRAPFAFSCAGRPLVHGVLGELALHQVFRRMASPTDPAFQVALPGRRFELGPELWMDTVEREFPSVRRALEDFHRALERDDDLLEEALGKLALPPNTFLERRQVSRAVTELPYDRAGEGGELLAVLPDDHPFRRAVGLAARFEDEMDPDHQTPLRRQRAYRSWLSTSMAVEGGYAGLRELLLRTIRTNGGEVREPERIGAVRVRRGTATGVTIAASGKALGAGFVIVGSPLTRLLTWVPDRTPFEELFERIGEPVVRHYRYTLHFVLASAGVPPGLGRTVFVGRDRGPAETRALRIETVALDDERHRITVEALVPRRGVEEMPDYVAGLREKLGAAVRELVPFLDRHLQWVDSPHDGLPPYDARAGAYEAPLTPWARGPQTMRAVWGFPVSTALGVCAVPVSLPLRRLLLCNRQVVPGLGLEGEILAAKTAADTVTRADTQGQWVRRGRWGNLR